MSATATGVVAALVSPLVMCLGFIIWDIHWKKNGGSAFALNMYKCTLASVAFLVMSLFVTKESTENQFQLEVFYDNGKDVGFLMLSSIIGIIVGDALWLEALQLIGSRRVIIVDATKPFIGASLDWIILGETLLPFSAVAMFITVVGVLAVSLEDKNENKKSNEMSSQTAEAMVEYKQNDFPKHDSTSTESNAVHRREEVDYNSNKQHVVGIEIPSTCSKGSSSQHETIENERASSLKEASMGKELSKKNTLTRKGYIFSSLNVMFDSYGVVLTKQYGARFTSWQINLVRFGFAGVFMLLVSAWFRVYKRISGRSDASKYYWYQLPRMKTSSWARISLGVAFVTFACPALSNYAVFEIPLGLALTLFSIAPLYTIPLVWIMKGEKPTKRGITGAMIAVTGVVLLVLFGSMND